MKPLDLVRLTALMERAQGRAEIVIGLIDGPVVLSHPDLAAGRLREMPGKLGSACARSDSAACQHGTFVAGILSARRGSPAPAICPGCTLLVRPIFSEATPANGDMPSAKPEELAAAILACLEAGAHVLNISAAIAQPSSKSERALQEALDEAAKRGVIVVAAAGNQGTLGGTAITSHPWVIPIAAYDLAGRPLGQSNLGISIGRRGLGAPGDRITSLGANGKPVTLGGTSAAAPFVTGAVALLWSENLGVTAGAMKLAVTQAGSRRRTSVVPPLLDAWGAYQSLLGARERRRLP
ncbi:MAG: S8 family serine peptidase [Beijerinckiaceae bacterium]|nr:S8 family serine peptidase [Acidobacteriota bacterium]MCI0598996.1 S8 family serine peptidase [Beijerinckiaceae bacterium]MCI0736270.1 S8 family serine peptidase [Beijerinckiaceae bacterium]